MMQLVFLHGLDSSPQGTKARLIRKKYPDCVIPSLQPDIDDRLKIVEKELDGSAVIVGSSLGGLTAVMFAMKYPQRIKALVLLAPAVGCSDEGLFLSEQKSVLDSLYIPEGIPTTIIAGLKDDVIPLAAIHALIERSPDPKSITLHAVDDGHDLHQSLELMMDTIARSWDQI